jgi:hypothetical protein
MIIEKRQVLLLFLSSFLIDVLSIGKKSDGVITTKVLAFNRAKSGLASFPLNKGNPLVYGGTDKLFQNPLVIPIFYGGGKHWGSNSASLLSDSFGFLSENYYFDPVFFLMEKHVSNPTFRTSKPILYYGPQSIYCYTCQRKLIVSLIRDVNIHPKLELDNSMLMIILDKHYSVPSHFKISEDVVFDSPNGFCAFHSYIGVPSGNYPYSFIGSGGKNCQWKLKNSYELPNPGHNDMIMSSYVHELSEMLTDPFGGGYVDNMGFENGDKCDSFVSGFNMIGKSNKVYNLILGKSVFLVQSQYDPQQNICPGYIYDN